MRSKTLYNKYNIIYLALPIFHYYTHIKFNLIYLFYLHYYIFNLIIGRLTNTATKRTFLMASSHKANDNTESL